MARQSAPLITVALIVFGCAALQGRSEKLREAVFVFNEGVRWGQIQDVLSRVDPAIEAHFLKMHEDFGKSIKVTECEVVRTQVDLEKGTAEVGVQLTWYRIDEMVVRETVLVQYWEEKEREWLMVREEFRSGTAF